MSLERRQHPRYSVKDNAFAVINSEPAELVPILDVAMGGLGVYVHGDAAWMTESSKLEIMAADCSFYMENIPFELISNCKASPAHPANLMDGRRIGLQFGELLSRQQAQLKYFIRNYTEGRLMWQLFRKLGRILHPLRAPKYAGQSCNTNLWQGLQRPTV